MKKKMVTVLLALVVAASSILGGCGEPQETGGRAEGTEQIGESGEPQETGGSAEGTEQTGESGETKESVLFVAELSEAKLLKEQERAKIKETLLEIINSDASSDEQKQEAVNAMKQLVAITEKEAVVEILLEEKGFSVVVRINDDAVDVEVNALTLTDVQRAQIEDIVKRKTEIDAENIVIRTVVQE